LCLPGSLDPLDIMHIYPAFATQMRGHPLANPIIFEYNTACVSTLPSRVLKIGQS